VTFWFVIVGTFYEICTCCKGRRFFGCDSLPKIYWILKSNSETMQKTIVGIILILFGFQFRVYSQTEKDVKSKISRVTIYSKGVQIESEAKFELEQGKFLLSFKNLSPFINKESVRVDGDGKYTILNVQLRNDYLNELEKNKEIVDLNASIQQYSDKIEDEETWIKILNEKLEFLKSNQNVTGKEQTINPEVFKSLNMIYGDNIEKFSLEVLKRQRFIKDYTQEVDKLKNQLNSLNSKNDLPSGIITVMVDSRQVQSSTIKLTYLVDNASWYPSFDIRFLNSNKPLSISYKANIRQNTGVDWKNVDLKLSTAKTNISAQIPTLNTNYLQFYYPEIVNNLQGKVSGISISNNSGYTGVSPEMKIRGNSSTLNNSPLYIVDGVPQTDISSIDPSDIDKMDVLKDASSTAIYGSRGANGVILVTTHHQNNSNVPLTTTYKNETSNEYTVDAQQTINSDNKLNTITFRETELTATYEYQAIPKLSKNVYLIAKIDDWYKADLMDGEANIYLENSFVGKSKINTQQFTDTLDISFGIDNNISVNREKIKDFSESQFIGSMKKETFAWKLTLRNNKTYPVKAKLFDQVPVSSVKDIQVEILELSGGNMNPNTGKVQWSLELNPNETKQMILKYSVKYPKDKTVIIE
jgi:TonB-dependent SusC/RagA subfamily outer membrane receptor